jgi:hypothetical protein
MGGGSDKIIFEQNYFHVIFSGFLRDLGGAVFNCFCLMFYFGGGVSACTYVYTGLARTVHTKIRRVYGHIQRIYIYIYTVHNVSNGEIKVLFFDIAQTFKNL